MNIRTEKGDIREELLHCMRIACNFMSINLKTKKMKIIKENRKYQNKLKKIRETTTHSRNL